MTYRELIEKLSNLRNECLDKEVVLRNGEQDFYVSGIKISDKKPVIHIQEG